MVRELAIEIYLVLVRMTFLICKLFPLQDKWTFMVTFDENTLYIYEEIKRQQLSKEIIFLYNGKQKERFDRLTGVPSFQLESFKFRDFFYSLYHLATSRKIIMDNYFGLLAVTKFKNEVECIQIWHAAGAIKTFGFEDLSVQSRTPRAFRRFQSVYNQFHRIVVGSDIMADRFLKAFHLPEKVILRTGIPRTDLFYNQNAKETAIKKLREKNPIIEDKKVILYAPTYRDQELEAFHLELDIKKLQQVLRDTHVLFLRLHPAVKGTLNLDAYDPGFVFDYTGIHDTNELLFITDLLITDYSSIPYEFSILEKPMIFYAYDEKAYLGERGLWEPYSQMVPGPIARTTDEILQAIEQENDYLGQIQRFSEAWNKYSKGHSSENLVNYLLEKEN